MSLSSLEFIEFHILENDSFQNSALLSDIQILLNIFAYLEKVWKEVSVYTPHISAVPIEGARQISPVNGPGRPPFKINIKQVVYLHQIGFRFSDMCKMFLIHRTTVWRRLRQHSGEITRYSNIRDEDLSSEIQRICYGHPHCGVTVMTGHLRSCGIIVQQRVRLALRMVDPSSSVLRWGLTAVRRKYSVP